MKCNLCKKEIVGKNEISTGYGEDKDGKKFCYKCCADLDKSDMIKTGKSVLYLTIINNGTSNYAKVTNWPGTLIFDHLHYKTGWHNWGLKRYDVWFAFNGFIWHGYTIGDFTQICHCKQTKERIY